MIDPDSTRPLMAEAVDDDATGAFTPSPHPEPKPAVVTTSGPIVPGYEILGTLGRGGMGVVYHAREVGLNREVALKMVLGHDRIDQKSLIRFLAEAEAVAAIDHPNVVRVHRYGEANGLPFMALEYLPGGSLGSMLHEGALAVHATVDFLRQIARGVAAAHEKGIVHRDLKPANVLLDTQGTPKVADFGLARRGPSDLTQTGVVMGTPAYMSPEQAKGETKFVGPSADVWALGVILYECLTGKRPFVGDDNWAIIRHVMNAEPTSLRRLNPRVPRDLELICQKCLQKESYERYPSAAELADDLDRFAAGEPITIRQSNIVERGIKWARRKPAMAGLYAAGAATVVLLAFGSALAWMYRNEANARVTADEQRRLAESQQAQAEQAKQAEAMARGREEQAHLATKKAQQELASQDALRKVTLAHEAIQDGEQLRAVRLLDSVPAEQRLWEWRCVAHMAEPELTRYEAGGYMMFAQAITADEKRLFGATPTGVYSWDIATGRERTGYLGHHAVVRAVLIHPDGRRAISASTDGEIHVWDIATGKTMKQFKANLFRELVRMAISPNGKLLAVTTTGGTLPLFDLDSGTKVRDVRTSGFTCLSVAFLNDDVLLHGGLDGELIVSNVQTGDVLARVPRLGAIWAICVRRDRQTVLTASGEMGFVAQWSIAREANYVPERKSSFRAHGSRIWCLTFDREERRLLTTSLDRTAKVWLVYRQEESQLVLRTKDTPNYAPGTLITDGPLQVLPSHSGDVMEGAFVAGVNEVITCADWALRRIATSHAVPWVIAPHGIANSFSLATSTASSLGISPDGKRVFVENGRAMSWPVEPRRFAESLAAASTQPVQKVQPGPGILSAFALSRDGKYLLEAFRPRTFKGEPEYQLVYRPTAGGAERAWKVEPSLIVDCRLMPDGVRAVTLSDKSLTLWNLNTGQSVWTVPMEQKISIDVSPDGGMIAVGGHSRDVQLYRTTDHHLIHTIKGHTNTIAQVRFSPDGRRLATASSDNTSRIWDVATGKEQLRLRTRDYFIHCVAFSPDGKRLAEGSGDGRITIYDAETGQDLMVLKPYSARGQATGRESISVSNLAFSPDGTYLMSFWSDRNIRIWKAPNDAKVHLSPRANDSYDPTGR